MSDQKIIQRRIVETKVTPEAAYHAAVKAADAAEAEAKIADVSVAKAVKAHDLAVAAFPKWTFLDEHRAMIRQRSIDHGQTVAPLAPVIPDPAIVRREAETAEALAAARDDLQMARDKVDASRATVATAHAAHVATLPPPITAEENVRAWIASNNADRAARGGARRARPYSGGPSAIDHAAHAMRDGGGRHAPGPRLGPDGQVHGGRVGLPGGRAYKRGGVSFVEAQHLNSQKIIRDRAAAAFKPKP